MVRFIICIAIMVSACSKEQLKATGKNIAKQNCSRQYSAEEYLKCTKNIDDYYDSKK